MTSRIAIACERCRFSKRRCQPPFPCTNCLSAGVRCDVRGKARPKRSRKPLPFETVVSPSFSPRSSWSQPEYENTASSLTNLSIGGISPPRIFPIHLDVFEVVRDIVARRSLDYYGQKVDCNLPEPKQSPYGRLRRHGDSPTTGNIALVTCVDREQAEALIMAMANSLGQIQSVDITHLLSISEMFFHQLLPRTCLGDTNISILGLPIDSLALLFASLALGCALQSYDFDAAYSFFNISTELLEEYTERSSLDLVSAYFMQHLFILKTGSSNRARGIIGQAIQAAHDLGIHKGSPSLDKLQTVRLYLLLYFADQYLAMSHNTAPIIKSIDYSDDLFDPLAQAEPQLQVFIRLVKINGHIFEHVLGNQCSYDDILRLESKIDHICAAVGRPYSAALDTENTAPKYEALVRIHMFWSRIMLRAPFIEDSKHWISSISICIRAAQMLLSIYLQIYKPSIAPLDQRVEHATSFQPQILVVDNNLPLSWRQVKRITTSALVIVYAYWYGEASHEETSRAVATALILIQCQRVRWRDGIDGAVKTLYDLTKLSNLKVESCLFDLLPGATTESLRSIAGDHVSDGYSGLQVQYRPRISTPGPRHLLQPYLHFFDSAAQSDDSGYGAASIGDWYGLLSVPPTIDDGQWMPDSSWNSFGGM